MSSLLGNLCIQFQDMISLLCSTSLRLSINAGSFYKIPCQAMINIFMPGEFPWVCSLGLC